MGALADLLSLIDSRKRVALSNLRDIAQNPSEAIPHLLSDPDKGRRQRETAEAVRRAKGGGGLLGLSVMPGVDKVTDMPEFDAATGLLGAIKLYRGVNPETGRGTGLSMLGHGLYSSPSKEFAKKYGKVTGISHAEGMPRNPLKIEGGGTYDAPGMFRDWLLDTSGARNIREFNQRWPDPGEFVRSLGYDGVWIGDEIVKY